MQIWDLDDLLQNPANTLNNPAAVEGSDSDGMDVDNPPKSNKGILFSSSVPCDKVITLSLDLLNLRVSFRWLPFPSLVELDSFQMDFFISLIKFSNQGSNI